MQIDIVDAVINKYDKVTYHQFSKSNGLKPGILDSVGFWYIVGACRPCSVTCNNKKTGNWLGFWIYQALFWMKEKSLIVRLTLCQDSCINLTNSSCWDRYGTAGRFCTPPGNAFWFWFLSAENCGLNKGTDIGREWISLNILILYFTNCSFETNSSNRRNWQNTILWM